MLLSASAPTATPPAEPAGSTLNAWLGYARRGIPVVPEHTPDPSAATGCDCRKDDCRKPGKHPRTLNGSKDATTDEATIRRWRAMWPHANLGTSLERARLVIIGPDSPEWHAEFQRRGLVDGPVARSGGGEGHLHYYRRLPAGVPATRICKPGEYDILAAGNAILPPSLHASGNRYEWIVPIASLDAVPELEPWACDELRAAAARTAQRSEIHSGGGEDGPPVALTDYGLKVYRGELPKRTLGGDVDRSGSLLKIGRVLYDAGAARRLLVAELAERDAALYRKYTDRPDATKQYHAIVDELERHGRNPRSDPDTPPASGDGSDSAAVCACAGCPGPAEFARMRFDLAAARDRLAILEPYVATQQEILSRPDAECSSDDKVVQLRLLPWLHAKRAEALAAGREPEQKPLGYLAALVGLSKPRTSKSLHRWSSDDPAAGAPLRTGVTRVKVEPEDGGPPEWESIIEVVPWGERPAESFARATSYALPPRPKHGGSQHAADARWGRCTRCADADVLVKGVCGGCRKVLGTGRMRPAAFEALKVQVVVSEEAAPPNVAGTVKRDKSRFQRTPAVERLVRQNLHLVDPDSAQEAERRAREAVAIPTRAPDRWKRPDAAAPAPSGQGESLGRIVLNGRSGHGPPPPARWRCPECPASERKIRPDGSSRCPRGHISGHTVADAEVAG